MLLWLVILLPLLGAFLNGIVLRKAPKLVSHILASAVMVLAFICASILYAQFLANDAQPMFFEAFDWLKAGNFEAPFHFMFDRLSGLMTLIVTGIGSLIHIYAGGYMHEEERLSRFFSYLNLFVFMMLMLVLSENMAVMFVGWEGVGLCSYLLIGYWFQDDANAAAGMKAFLVNRIGDIGFILGIFLTYRLFGTISFSKLADLVMQGNLEASVLAGITLITLCLFVAACGKSAQMPLYVWLPDAMAGPTPVSALIHAATMVTAGIYMMTRLNFLFFLAPDTMQVIAVVGGVTAFFAATIALVQTDIKRVLAYSTVSQLGYMVMACGVGAFGAGFFHVFTHACFKALLFLGAGSVIVAMHHNQEMGEMGGLRKYLPITYKTQLIGVLAIIGFPGFSGFFSKDEILWHVFLASKPLWILAVVTAGMTAFYMVRWLMLTFHGPNRSDEHTREHLHETPAYMWGPLVVLAFLSIAVGFLGVPEVFGVQNIIAHYFEPMLQIPTQAHEYWAFLHEEHSHALEFGLMGVSIAVVFIAAGTAVKFYGNGPSTQVQALAARFKGIHKLLMNKYYVDEIYDVVFVQSLRDMSQFFFRIIDVKVIDGIVNGVANVIGMIGGLTSFKMTGSLHRHGMVFILGFVVLISVLAF